MSLDKPDIEKIRGAFREEITAVESDVKEIYFMITDMQKDIRDLRVDVNYLRQDTNFIGSHLRPTLPSAGQ